MDRVDGSGERIPAGAIGEDGALPLLRTKLHRPTPAPGLEARSRLLQRLAGQEHRSLTLISAPAGYGKTTLASAWLASLNSPTAWVSLDETDDDLPTFANYLVAAARAAFPEAVFKAQSLLQAPVPAQPALFARYFANDLAQHSERLVLALDDVHLLKEPAIFDLLAELLRHPQPCLHLVLISRRDPPLPIATLRGRGEVVEIRARDLQFTAQETRRLLGQILDREVDDAMAAEWTERTEGWVTALRLVALSLLQRYGDEPPVLHALDRPHYVQEYLLADVLTRLPAERRTWLLRSAVLDRFCAPLCEAICIDGEGCNDLSGKAFIRWLQEDNLFLVSLDDQGRWFRFHHLFRDLLRELLAEHQCEKTRAAVHSRAALWFAENGLLDEAIQHAMAAGDREMAARMVEQGRYALMNTEQWARLDRWLRMLPPEVVTSRVLLSNAASFLAIQRGEEVGTITGLQRSQQLLAALPPESDTATVAAAELNALNYLPDFQSGRFDAAVAKAQRALSTLPEDALHIRSLATSIMASALHLGGARGEAITVLNGALADPAWPLPMRARLLYYLCTEHYLSGNLRGVLAAAAECVAVAVESQHPELASWGLYYLGAAYYARNEFAAAEPHLLSLMEHRALAAPVTLAFGAFALALIRLAQGRSDEASELIDILAAYMRRIEHKLAAPLTDTFKIELALRQGQPPDALRPMLPGLAAKLPRWYFYAPLLTEIKLRIADGQAESLIDARRQLDALEDELRRYGVTHTLIDALLLQAVALAAQGEESAALGRVAEALKLAAPGGFVRNFVDLGAPVRDLLEEVALRAPNGTNGQGAQSHIDRVLTAFGAPRAVAPPPTKTPVNTLIEPLTEREMELLRLVATDLSPVEIAERLSLSPTTVRTHIRNIYSKLDAHSRFEAVIRAKECGLL